jgi:hypothetical protein
VVTILMLPVDKHEHARVCPDCQGAGVTGERYEMEAGPHILLLEVICPACDGCGNGDPDHAGCRPEWHADSEEDAFTEEELGGDGSGPACWSCGSGRGWNAVQGFAGEGDDALVVITRVPCGCSESRLVEADQ